MSLSLFALFAVAGAVILPPAQHSALMNVFESVQCTGAAGQFCLRFGASEHCPNSSASAISINCTDAGVTLLALNGLNLNGTLPASLNQLTALSALELSSNNLHGSIPEMGALTMLGKLSLKFNRLAGLLPNLASLSRLTSLELNSNLLEGSLANRLSNLGLLRTLSAGDNSFSGSLGDEIGSLTALEALDVRNCSFSGSVPSALYGLSKLRKIDLTRNAFTGCLQSFVRLTELTDIYASNNQLQCALPELPTSVSSIQLDGNAFVGTIPASWASLSVLSSIRVAGNKLGGRAPEFAGVFACTLATVDLDETNCFQTCSIACCANPLRCDTLPETGQPTTAVTAVTASSSVLTTSTAASSTTTIAPTTTTSVVPTTMTTTTTVAPVPTAAPTTVPAATTATTTTSIVVATTTAAPISVSTTASVMPVESQTTVTLQQNDVDGSSATTLLVSLSAVIGAQMAIALI